MKHQRDLPTSRLFVSDEVETLFRCQEFESRIRRVSTNYFWNYLIKTYLMFALSSSLENFPIVSYDWSATKLTRKSTNWEARILLSIVKILKLPSLLWASSSHLSISRACELKSPSDFPAICVLAREHHPIYPHTMRNESVCLYDSCFDRFKYTTKGIPRTQKNGFR